MAPLIAGTVSPHVHSDHVVGLPDLTRMRYSRSGEDHLGPRGHTHRFRIVPMPSIHDSST
jgi:hypothetical protein